MKIQDLATAKSGDYVTFGKYVQTAEGDPQPIVWEVLGERKGGLLLLSRNILDAVAFNTERNTSVERIYDYHHFKTSIEREYGDDYESSTIRQFALDFYEKSFSEEEKARMMPHSDACKDRVFLLSSKEVRLFLPEERLDRPATEYAESVPHATAKGEYKGWWLRSREHAKLYNSTGFPDFVEKSGEVDDNYAPFKNGFVPAVLVSVK